MFILDHPDRMFVMVAGLPRTGTTIVASFLNSIDDATIWGEPHRSAGKSEPWPMTTRHAAVSLRPRDDVVDQIDVYADASGLWLRGLKEVLDIKLRVFPTDIILKYESKIDFPLVMFRDPRKAWSSIFAIGHHTGLGIDVGQFGDMYIEYGEFCLEHDNVVPVVMSKFIENPIMYMSKKLGLKIVGAPKLLQYTGGGDPHTVALGTVIRNHDSRPSYIGSELDGASKMYEKIVGMERLNV